MISIIKKIKVLALFIIVSAFIITGGTVFAQENIIRVQEDILVKEGEVVKEVVSVNGDIVVKGTVNNAVTVLGDIYVEGEVKGEAVSVGGKVVTRSGGRVSGQIIQITPGSGLRNIISIPGNLNFDFGISRFFRFTHSLFGILTSFALGAVIIALLPNQVENIINRIEYKAGRASLIGLLAFFILPFLTIMTIITIIGIFLVPFILVAYAVAAFYGYVCLSTYLGRKILQRGSRDLSIFLQLLLGLVIFAFIKHIPLVGFAIGIITSAIGLGAVIDTRFGVQSS